MLERIVEELNSLWRQQRRTPGLMANPEFRDVWNYILYYANEMLLEKPVGSAMKIGNVLITHIPRSLSANLEPTEDGYISRWGSGGSAAASRTSCLIGTYTRKNTSNSFYAGGYNYSYAGWYSSYSYRGYVEWDISVINPMAIILDTAFKYQGRYLPDPGASSLEINPLTEKRPSICTDAELYGYIASGTAYVDPFSQETGAGKEVDLGSSADSDLQTAIDAAKNWFAIGLQSPDDECPTLGGYRHSSIWSEEYGPADPPPTLYLEFDLPGPPTLPGSVLTESQTVSSGSRHIEIPYYPYRIELRTRTLLRHITRTLRG